MREEKISSLPSDAASSIIPGTKSRRPVIDYWSADQRLCGANGSRGIEERSARQQNDQSQKKPRLNFVIYRSLSFFLPNLVLTYMRTKPTPDTWVIFPGEFPGKRVGEHTVEHALCTERVRAVRQADKSTWT